MRAEEAVMRAVLFGVALAAGMAGFAPVGRAETFLCTLARVVGPGIVASEMRIEIGEGMRIRVDDVNTRDVLGAPTTAQVTQASERRIRFSWMLTAQRIEARMAYATGARTRVNYAATLDRAAPALRVKATVGSGHVANFEGPCKRLK